MHAVLADRTEQRLGQAAVTARAHDEQVGSVGRVYQHLPGSAFYHAGADLDLGVDGAHSGHRLGEDGEGVLLVVGHVGRRYPAGTRGDVPGGHRLHYRSGQLRLVNGPAQRGLGRLEAIHSDHDAALLIALLAHGESPQGRDTDRAGHPGACLARVGRPAGLPSLSVPISHRCSVGSGQRTAAGWPELAISLIRVARSRLARTRVTRWLNSYPSPGSAAQRSRTAGASNSNAPTAVAATAPNAHL